MSHTFCGTSTEHEECQWHGWDGKAIYIDTR